MCERRFKVHEEQRMRLHSPNTAAAAAEVQAPTLVRVGAGPPHPRLRPIRQRSMKQRYYCGITKRKWLSCAPADFPDQTARP